MTIQQICLTSRSQRLLEDPLSLARYLIDVPGVSGSEHHILKRLQNLLKYSLGIQIQRIPVDENRYSLFARFRSPQVVLSSHVDTVSPFCPSTVSHGYLFGRGACDTRGIIAAMLSAGKMLKKKGNRRLGFLFVIGEEDLHDGAKAAADFPTPSRFLVNGEPTECKLATGSKGAMRVIIRTRGTPCHSSAPELGKSAIHVLLDILADIRTQKWPRDPHFGETLVNIGQIEGGGQANVLARSAQALLMFRLSCPSERVKQELLRLVSGRGEIDCISAYEPLKCASFEGFAESVVGYGTDLPFLHSWGIPFLYGPGSILDAHTDQEKISIAQLYQAVGDYQRIVKTLTGNC